MFKDLEEKLISYFIKRKLCFVINARIFELYNPIVWTIRLAEQLRSS